MAHIMVCGAPGSGKSVYAQKLIDQKLVRLETKRPRPGEDLWSTIPLSGHDLPARVVDRKNIYASHCGVLFIDELQLYLGARDWEKMADEAKEFWTRHRHFDVTIVSTTQHPSFVDKMCRILTDEVHLVNLVRLPFIGWIWPKCVRPPDACACGCARTTPHARRDALGDRAHAWERWLGVGSLIVSRVYSSAILGGEEMLNPDDLIQAGVVPKSYSVMLFDMKWAARSRASVAAQRHTDAAHVPQPALV